MFGAALLRQKIDLRHASESRPVTTIDDRVYRWLLAGDPSIRHQVFRDLLLKTKRTVERERRKISRQGWAHRLLARQDGVGTWGGGLYNPKWISTTYTMLLLRDLGLAQSNPQAHRACRLLLDRGLQQDGGINFERWDRSETCVSGMVLSILSYFQYDDHRLERVVDHLLKEQMEDGGWNCRRPDGATHASVHTTISVLEGLHLYESFRQWKPRKTRAAQEQGREFLLEHHLFRSHRTGNVIKSEFTQFHFPPRWYYDILRALDHFRAADAPRNPRLAEAIEIVRARRQQDGRWLLHTGYGGKTFFEMERSGTPSRWNTLRALRVLKWWEAEVPAQRSGHPTG
jgi:hypothetical protein